MAIYTFHIPATFTFDVAADSEEEARALALSRLSKFDILDDAGCANAPFAAPWVAPAGADLGFPALELADVYGSEEGQS